MNKTQFKILMNHLAEAWTRRDHDTVIKAFAENIHYADPTRYSFHGLKELREFFGDGEENQICKMHATVFDEEQQLGAAEYTYEGKHRYHGVVLVQLTNDKISKWREYQQVDDREWKDFIACKK